MKKNAHIRVYEYLNMKLAIITRYDPFDFKESELGKLIWHNGKRIVIERVDGVLTVTKHLDSDGYETTEFVGSQIIEL